MNLLLREQSKPELDAKTVADHALLREQHAAKTREKKLLILEQARANRTPIDWSNYVPPKPEFTGVRVVTSAAAEGLGSAPVSGVGESVPLSRTLSSRADSESSSSRDATTHTRDACAPQS